MKKYSQFVKGLPPKSVVFAFGRFNPPTSGHELLVKAVKKLAANNRADHAIYASKSQDAKKNPLTVDKKVHYLELMFPNTHFVAANEQERTFLEAVKNLNKKYKSLIMVAGSDRVPEYEKILNKYNGKDFHFDSIQVISAGERDPDADDATGMSASKMRALATKGDYTNFKRGLPSSMRELDGRRLMNDVRHGMGLDGVKEQLHLVKDELREKYFRGEIFNIGDLVESAGVAYEIVKRGSNHLLLKSSIDESLVSKWIQDVSILEIKKEEHMNEELTTKTLRPSSDKLKVARVIATMLGVDNAESSGNPENLINIALRKIRTKSLNPESMNILSRMLDLAQEVGIKYDDNLRPSKLKEQYEDAEKPNFAQFVNHLKQTSPGNSLKAPHEGDQVRKMKVKHHLGEDSELTEGEIETSDYKLSASGRKVRAHHLKVGENEKDDELKESSTPEREGSTEQPKVKKKQVGDIRFLETPKVKDDSAQLGDEEKAWDPFFESVVDLSDYEKEYDHNMSGEEMSDDEIESMADEINDLEDVLDAYDDDELAIVDDETGEEVEDDKIDESALMEVLSRVERMKAKIRVKRTEAKRERALKIALKRFSSSKTINKRSRRLAIKLMKKRLMRGRDPAKMSVGEKERIERIIEKRKKVIGRLAMRLAPKVRKIEKMRMSHSKFTKGDSPSVAF